MLIDVHNYQNKEGKGRKIINKEKERNNVVRCFDLEYPCIISLSALGFCHPSEF